MKSFASRLLHWGQQHGRSNLPWQQTSAGQTFPDPYRIWIAEIMLQQTQVKTVIPYYQKFIHSFPDLAALAAASLDEVLAHWSGLGYYARARNLHQAALLQIKTSPRFPTNPAELEALPGIGLSTANAIASQATNLPLPILDGNAKRVLARHAGIPGWPGRSAVAKQLWQTANNYLPPRDGAAYTQAIMDLGAGICSRTKPDCGQCPVQTDCFAYQENRLAEFPEPKVRKIKPEQFKQFLIIRKQNKQVYLQQRPPVGIWGGLWTLPETQASTDFKNVVQLPVLIHDFSHFRLHLKPLLFTTMPTANPGIGENEGQWFNTQQWRKLGLPAPIRKILEQSVKIPHPILDQTHEP